MHEKPQTVAPEQIPNQDIPVSESFLREHEPLLIFLSSEMLNAALSTHGAVDVDVREALDSLIRTYRTLQSGLYYETRPANLYAAGIQEKIKQSIERLRKELAEKGATPFRDAEILGTLVFLQRIELHQNNGRPRGRSFIDYLRAHFPAPAQATQSAPPLIQV